MGWYVGDAGFEMKLTSKVSKLIYKHIQSISNKLLKKANLQFHEISHFAVHPGGRKILEAAETALGFSSAGNQFGYHILKDYGNMSSATILFVLKKLMDDPVGLDKENILGFAFGIGWTPCIGPTLGAVQVLAFESATAQRGAVLSAAYCFGLGAPFILMGLFLDKAEPFRKVIVKRIFIFFKKVK